MLLAKLTTSIKKMKQLDIMENAVLDAEKKAQNEAAYKSLVGDFHKTVKKLQQAVETLDYSVTDETVQYLSDGVEKLLTVISVGVVDAVDIPTARQYINRKVNPALVKEWKVYYQKKTPESLSKLNTLGHLAANSETAAVIRANISNGGEWNGLSLSDDGKNSRLELFKSAIDEIDELEESLNLSDEIKDFIVKVTTKKARVSDVNENIIRWIKAENLEERFVINFST